MLMTIQEVARELRVSPSLVYRLVASGELVCHRVAACLRVSQEDLRSYLATRREEPTKLPKPTTRHF